MQYVRSEEADIHILVKGWSIRWESLQRSLPVLRKRVDWSGRWVAE